MGEKEMKLDEDAGLPLVFREMQRMHRSRLQRVLNEYGLYMGQPMILFALERIPDATQKELADALHISSATITTSLQRMEKAGLLTRATDPRDTRCNHIVLTDKGRHVSSECHTAFAHMDEVMFSGFTQQEKDGLDRYLRKMIDNLRRLDGE